MAGAAVDTKGIRRILTVAPSCLGTTANRWMTFGELPMRYDIERPILISNPETPTPDSREIGHDGYARVSSREKGLDRLL